MLTRQLHLVEPIPVAVPRLPYAGDTQLVGVLSGAAGGHQQGAPVDVGVAGQPSGHLIESAVGDERNEIISDVLIYLCGGPKARREDDRHTEAPTVRPPAAGRAGLRLTYSVLLGTAVVWDVLLGRLLGRPASDGGVTALV